MKQPIPNAELAQYAEIIARHSGISFLDHVRVRECLCLELKRLVSGKTLETVYAPFEHVERGAELAIVGITPGGTQAECALSAARAALRRGADVQTAAREAKIAASFSGGMRANLCRMLDAAGVPGWFGIHASSDLFGRAANRVHFTSALRNPVFVDGRNYNGQPKILSQPSFLETIDERLASEVRSLPDAWWLPLWDVPAAALNRLVERGILPPDRLLPPMPHPAGGNGENISWFSGTTKATAFSSRRASTGELLLSRRDGLREFFAGRRPVAA